MTRHFPKTSLEYAMMQWFLQSAQRTHTVGVVALYAWSPVLKVWIQLLHYLQITTDFNFWSNPVLSNQPYSECSLISSFLWSNIWELNDVLCQESPPPKKNRFDPSLTRVKGFFNNLMFKHQNIFLKPFAPQPVWPDWTIYYTLGNFLKH